MTITCNHPASSYGLPVILDDKGKLMDYPAGLTAVLNQIKWTRPQAAAAAGYKTKRSIDPFWIGKPPSANLLNVLALELDMQQAQEEGRD